VGIRRSDALDVFLNIAEPKQIKEYVQSGGVFTETDIAIALFQGNEGMKRIIRAGLSHRVVFECARQIDGQSRRKAAADLTDFLENWEPIDLDVREDVADFFCELVVRIDVEGETDLADRIRSLLGKCFLDQRFTDEWDIV
jgi:hypothetical protein